MGWFNILDNTDSGDRIAALTTKRQKSLGCTGCALNRPGYPKVKNLKKITGKKGMIFLTAPSKFDAINQTVVSGPVKKFLLKELKTAGFSMADFDWQNVVRCRPTAPSGYDREPTKAEIQHCAVYTDEALDRNQRKARVYLLFGDSTQQAFLDKEYSKDRPIFWSEKLNAQVVCLNHPKYFLKGAPGWRLELFRKRLQAARFFFDHPSRFFYLKKTLDLKLLHGRSEEEGFFRDLHKLDGSKTRVSLDIEESTIDGKRTVLMIAASWERNKSRCLLLDHPAADPKDRKWKMDLLRAFLANPGIKKTFQYGPSDTESIRRLLGMRVRGYDFDTTYAHYFIYSFLRSHSLATIAAEGYPLFSNYKEMVDFRKLHEEPVEHVALYNNADACLTKLAELDFSKFPEVSPALMQTYIWAGIQLHRMETRGPMLDRIELERVKPIVTAMLKRNTDELRLIANNPDFNPGSDKQVAYVMYNYLGLSLPDGEKEGATGKEVLAALIKDSDHKFPKLMQVYRKLSKICDNYFENYAKCADIFDGELRTNWFITGAVTGRLRSSGGTKGEKINMQNLHGDLLLQNLLISDLNWRDVEARIVTSKN